MTTVTMQPGILVEMSATLCRRRGPGRGCTVPQWHACTAWGWTGEPWDGDQPPLTGLGHVCDPATAHQQGNGGR